MNRLGDDDLLSILDFNFTLEQVLARVAMNIGWVSSYILPKPVQLEHKEAPRYDAQMVHDL